MEVTFLSSTGSFSGVGYNMSKVMSNSAQILEMDNFKGLEYISSVPNIGDYTEYLKDWSSRNLRIKNAQFHVAISCKGTEKTKEELLSVAKQWLKEMGYEGIPALFVFHKDTNNNHIHIVTSRVDPNGNKVDHNNERWRGRAILKRIEGVKMDKETHREKIKTALSYTISNTAQFTLLLEQQKYKVSKLENGDLEVKQYGKKVAVVTADELHKAIEESKKRGVDESRIKQLKALLYKYKDTLSTAELKDLMKRSFGIDIVFFGKKDSPYGYALIDHKNKTVYKGSEIMPLKELMGQENNREKKITDRYGKGCSIIEAVLEQDKHAAIHDVNATLRRYGFTVKDNRLYHYGKELGKLQDETIARLDYNKKLSFARKIKTDNPRILEAVARHFRLNREDLSLSEPMRQIRHSKGYQSLQDLYDQAYLNGDMYAFLKVNNAYLFYDQGKAYVIDNDFGSISEVNTSNPERSLVYDNLPNRDVESNDSLSLNDLIEPLIGNGEGFGGANNEVKRKGRRR